MPDLKNILDNNTILTITDYNGVIIYANKKFLDVVKYDQDEIIGNDHRILKSDSHSHQFYQNLWNVIKSGRSWNGAIRNKTKEGTHVWLKTTIVPIFKNSKITHFISIRNDITEAIEIAEKLVVAQKIMKDHNRRLEKKVAQNNELLKQQKLSIIGELASRMSHDIRNPLAVIRGVIENIESVTSNDENVQKSIQRANIAIDRISHQIDDVLDFVRTRSVNKQHLKLKSTIDEILSTTLISHTMTIEESLDDSEIVFDQNMFFILIKNILINAIQACENKGTIKIHSKNIENYIIVEIEDSGPGIPDEIKDKIFEPLFTTKQQGTGLGLASCKNIIEMHGGVISVKNNPTTFSIYLPK